MLPEFDDSAVAQDIEAVCSKCGETWHVIVAVGDGKIAQVQCKSCMGYHKYKPIASDRMTVRKSTKTMIAASVPESVASKTRRTSAGGRAKAAKSTEPVILEPKVNANMTREIRKYNIHENDFQLGDRIEHAKFGIGVVDELPSPNKMYVTFQTERLLLVYGK